MCHKKISLKRNKCAPHPLLAGAGGWKEGNWSFPVDSQDK